MDFSNIDYLKSGNKKQQLAYKILMDNNIISNLNQYEPILAGTIPLKIDIETSDLDILCFWKEKQEFIDKLTNLFKNLPHFKLWENENNHAVIASFILSDFKIEIFGQNIPTKQQIAYQHMLAEYNILNQRDENFRHKIILLKQQGYKTEPAFGIALNLRGNPYEELLAYRDA